MKWRREDIIPFWEVNRVSSCYYYGVYISLNIGIQYSFEIDINMSVQSISKSTPISGSTLLDVRSIKNNPIMPSALHKGVLMFCACLMFLMMCNHEIASFFEFYVIFY